MQNSPLEMKRRRLRNEIRGLRDALTKHQHKKKSLAAAKLFFELTGHEKDECCFIYVGYGSEVDTIPIIHGIIDKGATVSVPAVNPEEQSMAAVRITDPDQDLEPGYKGILEPLPSVVETSVINPETIDIALIPGLVFDFYGNRLGYGGGYYDRFLSIHSPRALRVGLAFECQLTSLVPIQAHDIPMDIIITEKRIHRTHAR